MSSKKTFEIVQKQQFIDRKCFYKQSIDKEELKKKPFETSYNSRNRIAKMANRGIKNHVK